MSVIRWSWSATVGALCVGAAVLAMAGERPSARRGYQVVQYVEPAPGAVEELPPTPSPPQPPGMLVQPVPPAAAAPRARAPVSAAPAEKEVASSAHASPACDHCMPCQPRTLGGRIKAYWHGNLKPRLQDEYWGYPENFYPEPLGGSVYGHFNTQVGNGQAAQMILYQYDFQEGIDGPPDQLNAAGRRRLKKLSHLLADSPLPLMIERSREGQELDLARRIAVANELATVLMTPVSEDRILLVDPAWGGMYGEEADLIYQNMVRQTQNAPTRLPTGGDIGGFAPQ